MQDLQDIEAATAPSAETVIEAENKRAAYNKRRAEQKAKRIASAREIRLEKQKVILSQIRQKEEEEAAKFQKAARLSVGRPSTYTEEEAAKICAWIASGRTLTSYSKAGGLSVYTVYDWMVKQPKFANAYAQARLDRTETQMEEILDLADAAITAESREEVEGRKLAVSTRQWVIAKMNPKYSDKIAQHTAAQVTFNIDLGQQSHNHQPDTLTVQASQKGVFTQPSLEGNAPASPPVRQPLAALPVEVEWRG